MRLDVRYQGTSGVRDVAGGAALSFQPNLARPSVFFDAELTAPMRVREAVSALHDVVVGDLRFRPKDRSAYVAWQAEQAKKQAELERLTRDRAAADELLRISREVPPPNLEADFRTQHRVYWIARNRWASELARTDWTMFRHLVPCDPVVTVAPDAVLFECFSKDESAYGCLSVERGAFQGQGSHTGAGLGTTNVDYSIALYDHFQTLRSYRPTRLLIDPSGFEVQAGLTASHREEKIDLPASWLRGFGQLQAAMSLPARRVDLSVDVVYGVLAYLKRHREKAGPRSIRFRLEPGKPVTVIVDPWGVALVSRGRPYDGDKPEEIKVWGRRRLFPLARTLPLAERFDVLLLGSGLPSMWTARMGEMKLTLGLSGWTANDWAAGASLDQFFAGYAEDAGTVDTLSRYLQAARTATMTDLRRQVTAPERTLLGSLHALAKRGQLVFDYGDGVYRWRPVMPVALSESVLGPEPEEIVEGRRLASAVTITRDERLDGGKRLLVAKVGASAASGAVGTSCEGVVDADGKFGRARCSCSYFFQNRLRRGPCRHLLALRSRGVTFTDTAAFTPAFAVSRAVRRGQLFQLAPTTIEAITDVARHRAETPHAVVEQAWRVARARVQQIGSAEGLRSAAPTSPAPRTPQTYELDGGVVDELQAEAARLDVSVSGILEVAWALAKDTMILTASLLDPKA